MNIIIKMIIKMKIKIKIKIKFIAYVYTDTIIIFHLLYY